MILPSKEAVSINWKENQDKSVGAFLKYIKPVLVEKLMADKIEIVEGDIKELTNDWDVIAGIDYWFINNKKGIRGIASRIQFNCSKSWNTFTIRKSKLSGAKTEYQKRKEAIENDWLYPYWVIQGYLDKNGSLLSFALARTKDVIKMIDNGFCETNVNPDGTVFYVVYWENMKDLKYKIYIYEQ